jgi:lipooligosaccharide transport system permease protein
VRDVMLGHIAWMATWLAVVCGVFLCVMAAFGTLTHPSAVLLLPAAVLTGMAFATPIAAFAATRENDTGFSMLFRFGIVPMFLFSGTFFPIQQLPVGLRPVAYATPLWHGVDLCRAIDLGTATAWLTTGHVAYLLAWVVAGLLLAERAYARRLRV